MGRRRVAEAEELRLAERLETPDGWSYRFEAARGRITIFVPTAAAAERPLLQFILKMPGRPPKRGFHRLAPDDWAGLRQGRLDVNALAQRAAREELNWRVGAREHEPASESGTPEA